MPAIVRLVRGTRSIHVSSVRMSSGHGDYHHLPFAIPHKSSTAQKTAFAIKLSSFLALGFAIPFIASQYQISKSKGSAA